MTKRNTTKNAWIGTIIIMLIIFVIGILISGCTQQKKLTNVYNKPLIDTGNYIIIDEKWEWQEVIIVKRICKYTPVRFGDCIAKYFDPKWIVIKNGNPYKYAGYKSEYYVPVNLKILNMTKKNIFGQEIFIINPKYREIIYQL